MKIHRILCLAAVLVLPQLSVAKLPPSSALAQVESTLDFCAKNDPQSAGKYEERKKLLVQGEPEKDVAEARQTPEYKEAYDAINVDLGKVEKAKVTKACTSFLQGK